MHQDESDMAVLSLTEMCVCEKPCVRDSTASRPEWCVVTCNLLRHAEADARYGRKSLHESEKIQRISQRSPMATWRERAAADAASNADRGGSLLHAGAPQTAERVALHS